MHNFKKRLRSNASPCARGVSVALRTRNSHGACSLSESHFARCFRTSVRTSVHQRLVQSLGRRGLLAEKRNYARQEVERRACSGELPIGDGAGTGPGLLAWQKQAAQLGLIEAGILISTPQVLSVAIRPVALVQPGVTHYTGSIVVASRA